MTTGEDKRIFIDTNILIYANYTDAIFKDQARNKLQWLIRNNYYFRISRQIIREFLVYVTRYNFENEKISTKIILDRIFENLQQYQVLNENEKVTINLKNLIEKHNLSGKKIHDANIVATMQAYNITKLLTNNVKDFVRFTDVIEIAPLME